LHTVLVSDYFPKSLSAIDEIHCPDGSAHMYSA